MSPPNGKIRVEIREIKTKKSESVRRKEEGYDKFPGGPSSNLVVQLDPSHCLPLGVRARNIELIRRSQHS